MKFTVEITPKSKYHITNEDFLRRLKDVVGDGMGWMAEDIKVERDDTPTVQAICENMIRGAK